MYSVDTLIQDEKNDYQSDCIFNQTQASEENNNEIINNNDTNIQSTPMSSGVMVVRDIQGKSCSRLLWVLFDSGGSKSMMHKKILPRGAHINQVSHRTMMRTLA